MQCLMRRDRLLKEIAYNPGSFNDEKNKKILYTCISREQKLLEISRKQENAGESLISYAEMRL